MISINEKIDDIKVAIEAADLSREELIEMGVKEKAGSNRKMLLRYLRVKAKAIPITPVSEPGAPGPVEDPVDAPGEPPPAEEASKPLMQKVDPRPCDFPFRALDINRYPICVVHNSGLCAPCSHENEESGAMRCRVVCFAESDRHHNVKQPTVVMKDQVLEDPTTVEMVSPAEFDE